MVLRRSFIGGLFTSIFAFLGFSKKSEATVANWDKYDSDINLDNVEVAKDYRKVGDASSSFFSDSVKYEVSENGRYLYMKQGGNTITIDKHDTWKTDPVVFEFFVPSVEIALNKDGTINNICSPQNVAVGIANIHDKFHMPKVEKEYVIHERDESGHYPASVRDLFPHMEGDQINIVQQRYLPEHLVDKMSWHGEVYFRDDYPAWYINTGPVKIRHHGRTYQVYNYPDHWMDEKYRKRILENKETFLERVEDIGPELKKKPGHYRPKRELYDTPWHREREEKRLKEFHDHYDALLANPKTRPTYVHKVDKSILPSFSKPISANGNQDL